MAIIKIFCSGSSIIVKITLGGEDDEKDNRSFYPIRWGEVLSDFATSLEYVAGVIHLCYGSSFSIFRLRIICR